MNLLTNKVFEYLITNQDLYNKYFDKNLSNKDKKQIKQIFISRFTTNGDEEALDYFYLIKKSK